MVLKIVEHFGLIELVHAPNPKHRRYGVPARGPFDTSNYGLANALLGNDVGLPTLELSLAALTVEIIAGGALAWVGSGSWQGTRICQTGETVRFGFPTQGARSYLAGVDGFIGHGPLRIGSVFSASPRDIPVQTLSRPVDFTTELRVYRGAHASMFDWDRFLADHYRVDKDSNRMGVRLTATVPTCHNIHLTSEPTDVGIVQMTGSGNPIVLGPDGPTIGGYPRIACVTELDLARVAQLVPGAEVRFREVSREEGKRLIEAARVVRERSEDILRTLARS